MGIFASFMIVSVIWNNKNITLRYGHNSFTVKILFVINTIFVSPEESRGYLGFTTVTPPPPQRFPFGRDNLKNILVRTFKFGMWVYMGNATNAIVL